MASASRALAQKLPSAFRPAMVTDYGKRGADAESARWRAFRIFTNVATVAAGVAMVLFQDYPGSTATGEHALTNTQAWARRMVAGLITGDFPPPAALAEPTTATGAPSAQAAAPAAAATPAAAAAKGGLR